MKGNFIEECKERIALHSKLLMATIGLFALNAGGVASLLAKQSNPPLWGTTFGMLEAGAAVSMLCFTVICGLLYEIFKRIKQIGRAK